MRTLKWVVRIGTSALILGALVRVVGWERIAGALSGIDPRWILLFYGLSLVTRTIHALQMTQVLRSVSVDVGPIRVFLANSLAILYSLVTPGDMIASAAKWGDLSAASGKRSVVLNAMIYNRLTLLLVSLVIGSVALFWENPFFDSRLHMAIAFSALAVALLTFAIFSSHASSYVGVVLAGIAARLPPGIGSRVDMVATSLRLFQEMPTRRHATVLAIATLGSLTSAIGMYIATLALEVEIPFGVILWTQPALLIARQLPITISNLGIREGLLIYVFGLYGVPSELAFSVGILSFSGLILVAIVGLFYQLALVLGWATWSNREVG